MTKFSIVVGTLALAACSGGQQSTSTSTKGGDTKATTTTKPKPKPLSTLVGKCEPHKLPKTAWQPSTEQLQSALQQSEEDMRRYYEGGSISFDKGKLLEAGALCAKTKKATTFDMEVCGDKTGAGASGRTCHQLNVHSLDWKGRHWVSVYYNYGNESMIDIYEVRAGNVEPYCPAFTPQFHKLCNDTGQGESDEASCAKLEKEWKELPQTVQMALCFPGQ